MSENTYNLLFSMYYAKLLYPIVFYIFNLDLEFSGMFVLVVYIHTFHYFSSY